jgi:NAD(P)-dependent dehydrogenase (short-subunit alcohol dehydrogenase family)
VKVLAGKVAAITGAASGIGRALAEQLAREGCHLALSDVNPLDDTAQACRASGARVHVARVDVADRGQVHGWADTVARELGAVHLVVNNAGVALGARLEDATYEDLHWLFDIDFWGVVHGTRAFLPHLRAAGEGHVVNVSSVFGLVAVPTQGAYNAAKFAVRGFTEALRAELAAEGAPIGVTCVFPGGIRTGIARAARRRDRPGWVDEPSTRKFERALVLPPSRAAEQIVGAIRANRPRLLIGKDAVAIDLITRAMPVLSQRVLAAVQRRRLARRG